MRQRRRRFPAAVALAAALIGPAPVASQGDAEPEWSPRPVAVLQGLDKVTARISTVTAPVGEAVKFGTLSITVATCQEHPPTLAPESAAFLSIEDRLPDEASHRVFSGWMFASSPGLNALEHPVYDVWVLSCSSKSTSGQSSSAGTN
ncbi:MAG TPA: DUF2155 domain-containing protein [Thalassobaculum sp.]